MPGAVAGETHSSLPEWIWWEAEAPRSSNFPADNPFSPETAAAAAALSGRKWIGADHPATALYVEYDVTVRKRGAYDFYARKFWRHGPFRWRFDNQPWRSCGDNVALLDDVALAKFVNVNWVEVGSVDLPAGRHVLRIELDRGVNAVAFDCFLLIDGPFAARGKLKPGEKYGGAPEGWFAFEPGGDPFDATPLDLRWLNERAAGDGGYIRAKGDAFVHEKTGQPVRFWGVNVEPEILSEDGRTLDRMARRLAKLGVNIVRVHGPLWRDDDPRRIDDTKLRKLHRFVAALKQNGIYLGLSSYYPLWLGPHDQPGFEGYSGDQHPFGIAFFNRQVQQAQKDWWRTVLTAKNPHTGLTLLQDPTLAFIEIQNEDSLLFWTFAPYESVPAPQMGLLERSFGSWLAAKYGSIDRAFATWSGSELYGRWGNHQIRGDARAAGRVGLMSAGELSSRPGPRARDTAAFLAGVQRTYFEQLQLFLKQELGFQGSVTGSNWMTADARTLGPLDKWSNVGCDFIDRHGYFGGPHQGENAAFALSKGDRYNDASALLFETGKPGETSFELPIFDLTYNGKPSTISELNWALPNRFRTEMPMLAAAYGALQGSDGLFFFASDGAGWAEHLSKFSISDPVVEGQFPATALAFRTGLIRTGEMSRHLEAKLSDLFALKGAALDSLDPLCLPHRSRRARHHRAGGESARAPICRRSSIDAPRGCGADGGAQLGLRPRIDDGRRPVGARSDRISLPGGNDQAGRAHHPVPARVRGDLAGGDGWPAPRPLTQDASSGHERGEQLRLVSAGTGIATDPRRRWASHRREAPRRHAGARSAGCGRAEGPTARFERLSSVAGRDAGRRAADPAPDDSLLPARKIADDVRELEPTPGWSPIRTSS